MNTEVPPRRRSAALAIVIIVPILTVIAGIGLIRLSASAGFTPLPSAEAAP